MFIKKMIRSDVRILDRLEKEHVEAIRKQNKGPDDDSSEDEKKKYKPSKKRKLNDKVMYGSDSESDFELESIKYMQYLRQQELIAEQDEEEGESEEDEMKFEEQKQPLTDNHSSGLDPDEGKTPLNSSLVDSTINDLISNSSNANEADLGFTGNLHTPKQIEMVDLKQQELTLDDQRRQALKQRKQSSFEKIEADVGSEEVIRPKPKRRLRK